jgi:1-deoxy-D-xylulose-5-phosphate reductoisomerase
MRVPIAYGLCWPDRMESGAQALDFHALAAMTFEAVDSDAHQARFPGLKLGWQVLEAGGGAPAVLNAANEVAVAAFLGGRIRFDQIHAVNDHTLGVIDAHGADSMQALLAVDAAARDCATAMVARVAGST